MSRSIWLGGIGLLLAAASNARAEKLPSSPEELQKTATHIVVGKALAVYIRTEVVGDWEYTRLVAEVRVLESEKGDGLKKGDLLYARYYNRAWRGKGEQPPADHGHWPHPEVGETVRIYLARNAYDGYTDANKDGGFNVLGVNGFEKVKSKPAK